MNWLIGLASRASDAALCFCLLACAAPAIGEAADVEDPLASLERRQVEIFGKLGPSVVFISTEEALGTGFFVGADGLILTNAHVVGRHASVTVIDSSGHTWRGTVAERAADDIDLALVQIDRRDCPALTLARHSDLKVGSWLASVGHGRGGVWSFHTGMVSNIYPVANSRPVFQTELLVNPGDSGGPVVDRRGQVVGVITSGLKDAQAMNFAIRIEVALQSLSRLESLSDLLVVHVPAGLPVFVDGKMVGSGPRVSASVKPGRHEVFAIIDGAQKKVTVSFPDTRSVELK